MLYYFWNTEQVNEYIKNKKNVRENKETYIQYIL